MYSPLPADINNKEDRGVHLIYSEYDSSPSETNVEIIEGLQYHWWRNPKWQIDEVRPYYHHAPHGTNNYCSPQHGREVCLVYSDYDEPSSETSVNMDKFFYNRNTDGREVRLVYSDYDEPLSETDVEYDGRPWCSIFGNPAFWKIREEGRELHLIYSDYTEPPSEAIVEIDNNVQSEAIKISDSEALDEKLNTGQEVSCSTVGASSSDMRCDSLSDIYTQRPPELQFAHFVDSLDSIGQTGRNETNSDELRKVWSIDNAQKVVMPIYHLDNIEQLLAFTDTNDDENSILEHLEGQDLNTAKGDASFLIATHTCDTKALDELDQDASSSFGMSHDEIGLHDSVLKWANGVMKSATPLDKSRRHHLRRIDCFESESLIMSSTKSEGQSKCEITESQENKFQTMYFKDGKRKIDYVLTYECDEAGGEEECSITSEIKISPHARSKKEKKANKRLQYEANLRQLGLELEHVEGEYCKKTHFVLVHAPFLLLMKQAESVCLKMPVLQSDVKERTVLEGILDKFMKRFRFLTFDPKTNERLKEPNYFTAPFVAAHLECYVGHENPDTFFDDSERSRLVYDLLIRTRYDTHEAEKYRVGIQRLIKNGTYTSAFPLHEDCAWKRYSADKSTDRELLYWNWARISNVYKYQPLSLVKKYFGSKVGWYFAWLGYYTKALTLASAIGILCFAYGILTISEDIPSNDICGSDGIGATVILCPACDKYCDYTRLNSSCIYSKLSYVFDNTSTVIFAAMMSIFATLFLEGWKRYHAEVAWKWGLLDFEVDEETIRPEYQLRVKKAKTMRINPVTQQLEPYLTFSYRFLHLIGSGVTVLFFLFLVIAFVVGIIIYRIVFSQVLYRVDKMKPYANLVTFTTAATLNLAVILAMSYLYSYLALKLTDWECPRTQLEFDNSYTFKVYLFQFINYYSSIFYIAFVKGNLSSVPGRHYFGLRPEECDPAGCMVELVIQLAIIMCGKQFWNGFVEFAWPVLMTWFRSLRLLETRKQRDERMKQEWVRGMKSGKIARWEEDYILNPAYEQFLFDEYLEMVIQFGFVTLFVSAFPLAPLFALLNNIFEIRVDAYKYIVATRRPIPERTRDIGIWLPILTMISRVAVLVNACIIAFTSDFIPRFVYQFVYMHDELYGYVNNSLSYYDSSEVFVKWSEFKDDNITVCRFRDYRKVPCTINSVVDCDNDYGFTIQWWIVFTFRLAFVLLFEHVVAIVKAVVAYVIPDIPAGIFIQLQRQRFLARHARISDINAAVSARNGFGSDQNKTGKSEVDCVQEELVFEPGQFNNEQISTEFEKIVRDSFRKRAPSLHSLRTQESDSFHTCQS